MTREDKELLLKDLCARIPYGVKVKIFDIDVLPYESSDIGTLVGKEHIDDDIYTIRCEHEGWCLQVYKDFMPYLRSLSSMTEEEWEEWDNKFSLPFGAGKNATSFNVYDYVVADFGYSADISISEVAEMLDWLNSRHFDYRGLIPKGLAIEVTPENNPYD